MSKDMDEKLKLADKLMDVVDQANRKYCVTLLRHHVEKRENSVDQVRLFAKQKKREFSTICLCDL